MSKKPPISAEDQALFRETMRDVTPLDQPRKPSHTPKPRPSLAAQSFTPSLSIYDLSDYYYEPVHSESILSFFRDGLSKKQIHDLKSGDIRYEATLDLHGLRPDDAKDKLSAFIHLQRLQNKRTVLIVHGKGGRYHEAPILKNLVNHWLSQISDVLAFHSAHPKHGGTGAAYVLLSSLKKEDNPTKTSTYATKI